MTKTADEITKEKLALAYRILLDKNLPPAARLVGWYLADHINAKPGHARLGVAWPSASTIADDLGLNLLRVKRAIKALERAGYFTITRCKGLVNEYRMTEGTWVPNDTSTRVPFDTGLVSNRTHYPINEPISDPITTLATARVARPHRKTPPRRCEWEAETDMVTSGIFSIKAVSAKTKAKFQAALSKLEERFDQLTPDQLDAGAIFCEHILEKFKPSEPVFKHAHSLHQKLFDALDEAEEHEHSPQ